MKHLIRNRESGEFFRAGKWTRSSEKADDFPTLMAAVKAESRYHLRDVELVAQLAHSRAETHAVHLPWAER